MHTAVPHIERMPGRDRSFSHDRRHNWNLHFFRKLKQLVVGMCNVNASARQYKRLLCRTQQFIRLFQLSHMHALIRFVTTDLHAGRILCRSWRHLDVLRYIDEHRSWLSRGGNVERHLDDAPQVLSFPHRHAVLGDAPRHADNIHLLKCIVSNEG